MGEHWFRRQTFRLVKRGITSTHISKIPFARYKRGRVLVGVVMPGFYFVQVITASINCVCWSMKTL